MAQTINYNKKCTECNGEYFLGTIEGRITGSFLGIGLKESDTHIVCSNCTLGVMIAKEVIHSPTQSKPIVIY